MADIPASAWSETAASNTAPSPDGWPPNSSPNIVYTTDREMMGAIKREWNRGNATVTSTGSANAQVLSFTSPPAAMVRGMRFGFIAGFANTGATTIAISPLAPIAVQVNGAPLSGGELKVGLISELLFDGTNLQLIAGSGAGSGAYLSTAGGTLTGTLVISPGGFIISGASGTPRSLIGRTGVLNRWELDLGNNTGESTGNAGSDFVVTRYNDAGVAIDSPLTITRSSGIASFSQGIQPVGHYCRNGISGTFHSGSQFNIDWTGSAMQLWVDGSNLGNISLVSDYRTKRDITPLSSMWERAKSLKPISYRHKDFSVIKNDDTEHWGFVAHELQETLIEDAASGKKDQENLIQSPNPWTVIATLTKALQEAMARIEKLEARLPLAPETA